ncbi:hypothetical protein B1992_02550 [Pseudoxanthomonas broegbernensis]|uniref:T6SS Phospholipase effector Tle1-like catalytic domain-containing protein n=1 Tax=Pseudoxanthomonas broegbernensis TaxID=83619 RepID=A0A7V8GP61_9GAMM|nr:DUF2235 domain-containing protein [Pseudoxanthomonas broegbernensis]KAF1687563.1 hypothetical protein B1992_02550 [Pseudoxanthomonas broegbernensis]MBB6064575.1 uncharacterized protein (DUF2235 family) [Pseudoxanthomonas broegbernensis]
MAKNIVICCDGTGNEIGTTISNVLKLYRVLEKSNRQRAYYNPGVGTIGHQNAWQRFRQKARAVFGLATGYGLDDDVLGAYRFLCQTYEKGDRIWLFGFSRGAYTVRVLAAFLHVIGLLRPDQSNLAGYAFAAYKRSSGKSEADAGPRSPENNMESTAPVSANSMALAEAWHLGRVSGARTVRIEFVGVWDTVASVIVPRADRLLPDLQTLRFTRTNSSVKRFRQAIAIDERRRMFRLNRWIEPQVYRSNPFDPDTEVAQDIRQVWFAGVHADIGGGYPEEESGLSKFPLAWMIEEAHAHGLHVNRAMVNHLVHGAPRKGSLHSYVPPSETAPLHQSMNMAWRILEWLPKRDRWPEWDERHSILGWYLPRSEPRAMPDDALVHRSVEKRIDAGIGYRPINLRGNYRFIDSGSPVTDGGNLEPSAGSDALGEQGEDDAEV